MESELHNVIGAFVASIQNPETARSYTNALTQFEGIAPADLARVDETYLMPFADALSSKSAATQDVYLSAVISFFAFLIYTKRSEAVSLDRARMIKKKLRGRAPVRISNYPIDELQKLVEYAKHNLCQERGCAWKTLLALKDRALILTLAQTGLRRAEAARLKLRDVDLEAGQAVVTGKGKKQAVVYFGPDAIQALRDYIQARPNKSPDSPLFMRHDKAKNPNPNKHVTGQSIAVSIRLRAREALGYDHPDIHAHSLRHFFVTSVWRETHDLKLTKELARHESISTTDRYTHVSDDQLRDAHRRVFA